MGGGASLLSRGKKRVDTTGRYSVKASKLERVLDEAVALNLVSDEGAMQVLRSGRPPVLLLLLLSSVVCKGFFSFPRADRVVLVVVFSTNGGFKLSNNENGF